MANKHLPFPRGSTLNEDGLLTLAGTEFAKLEGTLYEVEDSVHNTGRTVLLRLVRNGNASAITVARKGVEFSVATAGDWGGVAAGICDTAGAVGKPIDDAYAVGKSIAAKDYFYVVEAGPCNILTEASSVNLAAGAAVAFDNTGAINGAAATEAEFIVGVLDAASTDTATAALVWVEPGIKPAAAAA
jgi:hypothetical protein